MVVSVDTCRGCSQCSRASVLKMSARSEKLRERVFRLVVGPTSGARVSMVARRMLSLRRGAALAACSMAKMRVTCGLHSLLCQSTSCKTLKAGYSAEEVVSTPCCTHGSEHAAQGSLQYLTLDASELQKSMSSLWTAGMRRRLPSASSGDPNPRPVPPSASAASPSPLLLSAASDGGSDPGSLRPSRRSLRRALCSARRSRQLLRGFAAVR